MLLVFASLWLGAGCLRAQGAAEQTQHLDPSAQEHIHQLIASLPRDSIWRNLLEHDYRGDGVRRLRVVAGLSTRDSEGDSGTKRSTWLTTSGCRWPYNHNGEALTPGVLPR
jgi:hypothetical protein